MKDVSFSLLTQTSYWNNAFFATPHRYEWISLVSENNDAFILSYNTLTIGLTRIRYYFYNILFCPKITTSNIFKISEKNMYIAEHRKLVIVPRNVHTVSRISSYNTLKQTETFWKLESDLMFDCSYKKDFVPIYFFFKITRKVRSKSGLGKAQKRYIFYLGEPRSTIILQAIHISSVSFIICYIYLYNLT